MIFSYEAKGIKPGGTREYRYGGSIILGLNELIKK